MLLKPIFHLKSIVILCALSTLVILLLYLFREKFVFRVPCENIDGCDELIFAQTVSFNRVAVTFSQLMTS